MNTVTEIPQTIEPRREGRAHDRVDATFEVAFSSETNFYNGFSENISEGGLFVATYQPRPLGTRLMVAFMLPGIDEPLGALCEVRWLRSPRQGSNTAPGMGLRFVEIDDRTRALVERFVSKRDPIFYDD